MNVIIVYVSFILIFRLFFYHKKYNNFIIIISGTGLFFISSMRSIYFGSDTLGYVTKYKNLAYKELSELFNDFITGNGKDPFFYFISKLINNFGVNYQFWIAIISAVFILSIMMLIKNYSPYPILSFISLISFGFFYFSLTGLRQTLAISLVLFSYKYLKERKFIPFVLIIFISSLFHSSSLIFLISYPLINLKINIKHIIILMGSIIISIYFDNLIRNLIDFVGWNDTLVRYANQEVALSFSGFIIQFIVFSFCMILIKRNDTLNSANLQLTNMLFIGLVFQLLSTNIAEFFRISMYFFIFSIILIPQAIFCERNKYLRMILIFVTTILLIIYIFWTNNFVDYYFFWAK